MIPLLHYYYEPVNFWPRRREVTKNHEEPILILQISDLHYVRQVADLSIQKKLKLKSKEQTNRATDEPIKYRFGIWRMADLEISGFIPVGLQNGQSM